MFNHTTVTFDDCVLAYDLHEQKYLFISPGVFAVLGITAKQLYQNNSLWDNLIPQKNLAGIKGVIQNLTPNTPVELSYHINIAQHRVKNITDKKTLIVDEGTGHSVLLSEIKEDTSKNHLITESSKIHHTPDDGHSKQFLNSLIDSQTSFLIRIDTSGNYSFVNRQYLKTFGYTAEYLLGNHFSKTTIPQEAHLCQNAFVQCLKNPGKIIPLLHKKPDVYGNLHDTEWELISIVDENGAVCEIQGIGQDITERLKIEAEIKSTAQKLDAFIESITDSFFIVDNNWRFVRVNAAFEKTGNKSRHELLGKVIWDVFPALVNTGFEQAYQQALEKKKVLSSLNTFSDQICGLVPLFIPH
ncbi:PAS domain-containing protein [Mucilaginibacter sp. SP1R1]|uniref:PAS domain-containing protein n=1 Tax=Mucilaginibacter sp. SP1R1 TaxID=2723091 RepID=UPI003B001503